MPIAPPDPPDGRGPRPSDPAELARWIADQVSGEAADPAMEAAWQSWADGLEGMSEHHRTLLRAAFEAGWEARVPTSLSA